MERLPPTLDTKGQLVVVDLHAVRGDVEGRVLAYLDQFQGVACLRTTLRDGKVDIEPGLRAVLKVNRELNGDELARVTAHVIGDAAAAGFQFIPGPTAFPVASGGRKRLTGHPVAASQILAEQDAPTTAAEAGQRRGHGRKDKR
jgi:hypothetical protein